MGDMFAKGKIVCEWKIIHEHWATVSFVILANFVREPNAHSQTKFPIGALGKETLRMIDRV